jgi:diguanylate cyclase (GGDEF)-like protein/PAS domain S-box-containing protein
MEIIAKSSISVPDETIQKWQNLVDIVTEIIDVPVVLINRITPPRIKILCTNTSPKNPYRAGAQLLLADHYCDAVVATGSKILVANSTKEKGRERNAALQLGFIAYLGFPICWPDGDTFGTFCILDNKERKYSTTNVKLMSQFDELIEAHLATVYQNRRLELIFESLGDIDDSLLPLIEKAADAIISADYHGNITFWSYGAQLLFGYSPTEAIGKPLTLIVAEKFRDIYQSEIDKTTLSQYQSNMKRKVFNWTGLSNNGIEFPVEIMHTPWRRGGELCFTVVVHGKSERKVLGEIIQRRNQELAMLNKVTQTVTQSIKLNEVLTRTLDIILEMFSLSSGGIYLNDDISGKLVPTVSRGLSDDLARIFAKAHPGMVSFRRAGTETHRKSAADVGKSDQIAGSSYQSINLGKMQYVLALPLKSKGRELGMIALAIESENGFPAESIQLLESISNQVAIAVENAQLYEKANKLSITDELTGLYNRRHFNEVLQSEIARLERYGGSLVLTIIDLDGFKQYNDKFGHPAGDSALRIFSQTMRSTLRKTDIVFRYGGDEFVIILPATTAARAQQIITRMRTKWLHTLEEHHISMPDFLGFSAGIAQFPENGETAEVLTSLADSALYHSKKQGRNKCTVVSEIKEKSKRRRTKKNSGGTDKS